MTGRLTTKIGGPAGSEACEAVGRKFLGNRLVAAAGILQLSEAFSGLGQPKDGSLRQQTLLTGRNQCRIEFHGRLETACRPLAVDKQQFGPLPGRRIRHQQFGPAGRIGAGIATHHLIEALAITR